MIFINKITTEAQSDLKLNCELKHVKRNVNFFRILFLFEPFRTIFRYFLSQVPFSDQHLCFVWKNSYNNEKIDWNYLVLWSIQVRKATNASCLIEKHTCIGSRKPLLRITLEEKIHGENQNGSRQWIGCVSENILTKDPF